MLVNYLRIAYRNLLKNQVFTFINLLGVAIGMAAFLLIMQYVRFERSYESFHKNGDNILRVVTEFYNGSELSMTDCETFAPLGPMLKSKLPEVTDFVRMYGIDGAINVKSARANFLETGMYWADHSAFDVFTYDVIDGDPARALTAPFEAVLTKSMAKKYFGRTDIVGEPLEVDGHTFQIKAVIADLPPNTHLKFSFLLSRLSFPVVKSWYRDDLWNNNNEFTYILTVPGTDVSALNNKLSELTTKDLRGVVSDVRFVAEPIKDIHLYSDKSYEPEPGGNSEVVNYLAIIAVFIIAIAWVNYVNLSTARAVGRAREVGIRKVMGSARRQLIMQFLAESLLVNVVAGVLAVMIVQLALPFFGDLTGQPLPIEILKDPTLWILFAGLLLGGTILSGIYPAFVLSSFDPAHVLKGKLHTSSHGQLLRKGLVVFQFSATVVLIISMCTVYLQVQFMRNQNLGMEIDQVLVLTSRQVNLPDSLSRLTSATLKTELLRNPAIRSVARGGSLPGVDVQELSTTTIVREGAGEKGGYVYSYFGIDADYVPAMNMSFAAGRNFEADQSNYNKVIINEEAASLLGFTNPESAVGERVDFRYRDASEGATVIGVLKNFHFRSAKEPYLPMLFHYDESADYFVLKVRSDDMAATVASVNETWNSIYPDVVFNHFFLDEKYNQQFRADAQFGQVISVFSGLTIFIACLGLFGLSSYTIVRRTKEIGIRKVLGASVTQIARLLSMEFTLTVLIGAMIAVPVGYFVMDEWLSQYAVRISMNAWLFIASVGAILLLALVTVSFQTISTARANPTESLRQE